MMERPGGSRYGPSSPYSALYAAAVPGSSLIDESGGTPGTEAVVAAWLAVRYGWFHTPSVPMLTDSRTAPASVTAARPRAVNGAASIPVTTAMMSATQGAKQLTDM